MTFLPRKLALAAALGFVGLAQAATISHGPVTLAPAQADWDSFLSVARFDPSLGTLQSVDILLNGTLDGHLGAENMSSRAATLSFTLRGDIELQRPDSSALLPLHDNVLVNMTANLPKYDGMADFVGSSGMTLSPDTLKFSGSTTLSGAADLALFTGQGTVALPIVAYSDVTFVGPGNARTFFTMYSGVSATVSYTYAAVATPVPEPSTYALMALGLAGIGLAARRRASKTPA